MNNNTLYARILLASTLIVSWLSLNGQSYLETSANNICPDDTRGSIELILDVYLLTEYPLPYTAEWENLSNGDYEEFDITSLNHTIDELLDGEYNLIIYLSDVCQIETEEEIFALNCILTGQTTDVVCTNDGEINVDIVCDEGGHEPWQFQWNDGPVLEDRTNLAPGTYCLTATDAYSCQLTECFTISGACPEVYVAGYENFNHCIIEENGEVRIQGVYGSYNIKDQGQSDYRIPTGLHCLQFAQNRIDQRPEMVRKEAQKAYFN